MTPYDGAMVGVILAGLIWGAFRGVTWQIASIASLVLGYSVSHTFSARLVGYFPGEPIMARSLAMITVYFVTSGGVFLVAWLIRASLAKMKFEAFDRHLGMLLGGLEGMLLGLVATLFVVSLAPQTRGPIFASPSGKAVGWLMVSVGPVLPSEVRDVLGPFLSLGEPKTNLAGADSSLPPRSPSVPLTREISSTNTPSAPLDPETRKTTGTLGDLFQEEEARLSKAISAGAAQGVKQAVGGFTGGPIERR